MYSDPTKLRSNVVKIRLSDEEHRLIQALVDYSGEQKAPLLRELIINQALSVLGVNDTSTNSYCQAAS
jgi:predicted DNA-binding protein